MPAPYQQRLVYESDGWQVDLVRRELRASGVVVPIGDRAFDILEALIQAGGALVTKNELMSQVWPGISVEDNTLQVHVSALRKALGPDRALLKTASGRGYRLLGNWTLGPSGGSEAEPIAEPTPQADPPARMNLPTNGGADLIGRDSDIDGVQVLLSSYRIVTLTGPGGIGKTKLALEVARRLFPSFQGDICAVELVSISDPALVPSAVAGALRLKLGGSEISVEAVGRAVGETRVLIILDNCEHVIDAAARLSETMVRLCPLATILATGREELRIEGECVYAVPPLTVPPADELDPSGIRRYSAVQLFLANITALRVEFSPPAEDLVTIAALCRRLDGIPLAIEFAAARVATLGVREVAARLDNRFDLLTVGRRTALPRHQTLGAILDWSYDLLSETERVILRRLSVFAGPFSLEAAQSVAAGDPVDGRQIIGAVADLVAKSLIAAESTDKSVSYRLLETTRAYMLTKIATDDERAAIARLHARYYCKFLEQAESDTSRDPVFEAREAYRGLLPNVRAALEWCFSADGDREIGAALAAASAPLFLDLSLLTECRNWAERSIASLDDVTRGTSRELKLQISLAVSLMFTKGNNEIVRIAFERGLLLAEQREDPRHLRILVGLHLLLIRVGDYSASLAVARSAETIAKAIAKPGSDPVRTAVADAMLGHSEYELGDLIRAQSHLEAALAGFPLRPYSSLARFGFDHRIRALLVLTRTLWLRGFADQALTVARQTLADAETLDHPVSLCVCLIYTGMTFLCVGDWTMADEIIERQIAHSTRYSLAPYYAIGRGFKGVLCLKRGETAAGIGLLRTSLATLRAERHETHAPSFGGDLAEGLAASNQFEAALESIDETLSRDCGQSYYTPELWRIKGHILASAPGDRTAEAEEWLLRAMDKARQQSALSLELRAALNFAETRARQHRRDEGRVTLKAVYGRFTEGFGTADLRSARTLLATLQSPARGA
jgi:predicted ATPase/DNA-binding winged helix-turn-helix (wHTH) protein